MHHPQLTVSLPPKKIHQQPEGGPRDRKPCLPRPRNLPDSVPYKSDHLWQRVHMGFTHCGRGCWWSLSICSLLFLNKRASNSELSSLLLWLKSLYPTSHAAGCGHVSEFWQWDVSRSDMYQFLEVSSKGSNMPSSAPPPYSFLGFRHDGWAQATIFRQWGRKQCSRSLCSCLIRLGLLTSGIHVCERKSKFSFIESLSRGSYLTLPAELGWPKSQL